MNKITPNRMQKFEFYGIFLNNIFLLLGVSLFGWTLFDTLFLFWLEAISAIILLIYLYLFVPLKYGRPGTVHLSEFRIPAIKTIVLSIWVLLLHPVVLVELINYCKIETWDTTKGILSTLAQMPRELWRGDLLLLTIIFLLVYLLPPLLLERQGVKPSIEVMPLQTRVMVHSSQFILCYIWFGVLWAVQYYGGIHHSIALVAILVALKSISEAYLFVIIKRTSFLSV